MTAPHDPECLGCWRCDDGLGDEPYDPMSECGPDCPGCVACCDLDTGYPPVEDEEEEDMSDHDRNFIPPSPYDE